MVDNDALLDEAYRKRTCGCNEKAREWKDHPGNVTCARCEPAIQRACRQIERAELRRSMGRF